MLLTILNSLPRKSAFYEVSCLLSYCDKDFSQYLKLASHRKQILDLMLRLRLIDRYQNLEYLQVTYLKQFPEIIIFEENSKAIYLHWALVYDFLKWCLSDWEQETEILKFLKNYQPSKPKHKQKGRGIFSPQEDQLMVLARLRGQTYQDIAAKFYCHRDTARYRILKAAAASNIKIPCRQKKASNYDRKQ